MSNLINEYRLHHFLKGLGHSPAQIRKAISSLEYRARTLLRYNERDQELINEYGESNLPRQKFLRVDQISRLKASKLREKNKSNERAAKHLVRAIRELFSQGHTEQSDGHEHEVTFEGDLKFFNNETADCLSKFIDKRERLTSRNILEDLILDQASKPNCQFSRQKYVVHCCVVWCAELGHKYTYTSGTGDKDGEALGDLPDFIMMASERLMSSHEISRRKLRNVLRQNDKKIRASIHNKREFLKLIDEERQRLALFSLDLVSTSLRSAIPETLSVLDAPSIYDASLNLNSVIISEYSRVVTQPMALENKVRDLTSELMHMEQEKQRQLERSYLPLLLDRPNAINLGSD